MGKTEGGGWYSQVGQGGMENLSIKSVKPGQIKVELGFFCGGIFLTVGLMITFSLPQPQYFGHWWEGRHLFHPEKSYMLYKKFENKKDCTNGWIGDTDPSAPRNMVSRLSYMLVQGWGQNHPKCTQYDKNKQVTKSPASTRMGSKSPAGQLGSIWCQSLVCTNQSIHQSLPHGPKPVFILEKHFFGFVPKAYFLLNQKSNLKFLQVFSWILVLHFV